MGHREVPDSQRSAARRLRSEMTDAERRLWQALRGNRFGGLRFRRQVPIGPFIADFVCHEALLVIEVDGGQHAEDDGIRRDAVRTGMIEGEGYRVMRFWNSEIAVEFDAVLDRIHAAVVPTPLPVPPPQGGRGR